MKQIITTTIFSILVINYTNAQNWELRANAGGNTTFVSGIYAGVNWGGSYLNPWELPIGVGGGSTYEGWYLSDNPNNKIGYYADGEIIRHLGKNWSLSVSLGVNKTNYTYDVPLGNPDTASMKAIDKHFGDTKLFFINSRFLNVTKSFSNLSLSAGPVLNLLIHDNGEGKTYTKIDDDNYMQYISSPLHKPNKFLYGGNITLGYKLAQQLDLRVGAQYYFNSVYKKGENIDASTDKDKKVNPTQISLGLSYSLMKF
ncbi:MAG: hypothetical protein ACK5NK_16815 [Niabella sp.]